MTIPATSLNASTTPAAGTSVSLGAAFSKHNALFTVTGWSGAGEAGQSGGPGDGELGLYLDGSLDGDTWYTIAEESVTEAGQVLIGPSWNDTIQLALYLRARWAILNGSPSATVTAVIASAA